MSPNECVAMILAGGQGSRLGVLTKNIAKPAVPFGGKYRIIDFTLSNCVNSDIDAVGVLTQYQPLELNTYIGSGQPWDLDRNYGGVCVLPPFVRGEVGEWYKGTANAIFQNFSYIQQYNPKYVLILSGDHIYRMDYSEMIKEHVKSKATATIAVINVPLEEAGRFGIMNCGKDGVITEFEEKPKNPKSTLASMGIYVFNWQALKRYLIEDENNPESSNDFGKNIIPKMLKSGEKLKSYVFDGYWRDVGTIESLWQSNMDLLKTPQEFVLDGDWRFYSKNAVLPPQYIGDTAVIKNSSITEGCNIYGRIENSIISPGVNVFNEAVIKDSIIMPNVRIGYGVYVEKAIIGSGSILGDFSVIGRRQSKDNPYASQLCSAGITVVGPNNYIDKNMEVHKGSMIENDLIRHEYDFMEMSSKVKEALADA